MKWSIFGQLAKTLAPIIISAVDPKLAPLANDIGNAISEAEEIPGASSTEKLGHVQAIASATARGINSTAGRTVVDTDNLNAAVASGVNTVVQAINAAHPVVHAVTK